MKFIITFIRDVIGCLLFVLALKIMTKDTLKKLYEKTKEKLKNEGLV